MKWALDDSSAYFFMSELHLLVVERVNNKTEKEGAIYGIRGIRF